MRSRYFIYGLPGDSWRTVKAMRDATIDLGLDFAFYIPLTGLPGSDFWSPGGGGLRGAGLEGMNFLTAAGPDGRAVRRLTSVLAASFFVDLRPSRLVYMTRTLMAGNRRRRNMNRRLFWRGTAFALRQLASALVPGGGSAMRRPSWYES